MLAVLIAAVFALLVGLFGTPMFIKLLVRRGYGSGSQVNSESPRV